MMAKQVSTGKTIVLIAHISFESKDIPFDQMKISKNAQSRKNWKAVIWTINKKTHQFHSIKSNKEVTLKTPETHCLYKNLKTENCEKCFSKIVFQNFSLLGKSHNAKTAKRGQFRRNNIGVSFKMG